MTTISTDPFFVLPCWWFYKINRIILQFFFKELNIHTSSKHWNEILIRMKFSLIALLLSWSLAKTIQIVHSLWNESSLFQQTSVWVWAIINLSIWVIYAHITEKQQRSALERISCAMTWQTECFQEGNNRDK